MTTKERIIELLLSTKRGCIDAMIDYLIKSDFFQAPASTRFYGCYAGGLADHSLAVFDRLNQLCLIIELGVVRNPGQKPLALSPDNIIIAALLHDVCKIGAYLGDEKPYKWNKQQPKGHATLSIERIRKYIALTELEEMMIRFHMGVYGLNEFYEEDSWEYKTSAEYSIRGDHSEDEKLSKEESQKARYGKSLRNAWYHNPIVKVMYFCDELAVLEQKAKDTNDV